MKNDVIDVEVKDVKIEQFLSEKKELVLNAAQRTVQGYLEIGQHLKETKEFLDKQPNRLKDRWVRFCENDCGFTKQHANRLINTFDFWHDKVESQDSISSVKILNVLAAPSNDPEKVALVEQKLAKGEKMTVAQVKEALKKLPEKEREVVAQASYEIAEEKRTGMTIEEIQADHKRADEFIVNDLPRIKQEAKDNRKATYQEGLEKLDDYVNDTKEVQEWLFAIIKQIPLDKQPAVSKKALYSTFNICYDGACAETDVVNFIETNINTY